MFAISAVERNLYFLQNLPFRLNTIQQKVAAVALGILALIATTLLGYKYLKESHYKQGLDAIKVSQSSIYLLETNVFKSKFYNYGKSTIYHMDISNYQYSKLFKTEYFLVLKGLNYKIIYNNKSGKNQTLENKQLQHNEISVLPLADKDGSLQIKVL